MTSKIKITHQDKIKILQREIKMRRKAYKSKVYFREMSQEQADFEIAGMEAILEDYQGKQSELFPS